MIVSHSLSNIMQSNYILDMNLMLNFNLRKHRFHIKFSEYFNKFLSKSLHYNAVGTYHSYGPHVYSEIQKHTKIFINNMREKFNSANITIFIIFYSKKYAFQFHLALFTSDIFKYNFLLGMYIRNCWINIFLVNIGTYNLYFTCTSKSTDYLKEKYLSYKSWYLPCT